ncbi:ABC transporter ATP-binding protein [Chitinophaga rhizosphaerae]|uniref:ABC transporter ATP-binding protein n=1 Tax=Chitinophaga rhizosphaerae TaxID=1864947 RepID=UPI000F7FE307|nr:ABC transporter ATP-binding protein [Chitinophaga rhizosphaerae]
MEHPVIELEGLTKRYGRVKAVDDLSLSIGKGEIFGLIGPNGAGKTTTILMMLGLSEPTGGRAMVCGIDATRNPIAVKRKVGYMPDSVGFYDNMTALENLQFIGRLNGIPEQEIIERAHRTMQLVGLSDAMHKKTGAYSRGMKQRLGLADILIREPEVMILDEPTLGIDPSGIQEFLGLVRRLSRQQGLTVLLSSHHLHHMQQICDRVGIFVEGKLLMEGDISSISGKLFGQEPLLVTVTVQEPLSGWPSVETALRELTGVRDVTIGENSIGVTCGSEITPAIVRLMVEMGIGITGVHRKAYGLDDIYARFFENHKKQV